jgi:hypothetical protein
MTDFKTSGVKRTLPRLKRCCIDCNAMQTRRRTYGRRSGLISQPPFGYIFIRSRSPMPPKVRGITSRPH